jgi:putative transposase
VLITDKLGSYSAAKKEVLPSVEHRQHKRAGNRAENSDQPTRQRERPMRRFKSAGHAQRFLAAQGPRRDHFCPRRDRLAAQHYREAMQERFVVWNTITGIALAI